ncbi:MAG: 3-hydroxyacyl-CoA dehydrogenase [Rhodospirillaceae bacterium]|nr:3-hydroxyacyl-CoA dehydrogenase [Rhodospirillaceae bacterium]
MGAGIAASFCAGDWITHVAETNAMQAETIPGNVQNCLEQLEATDCARNLNVATDIAALPWDKITIVVEAVSENLELKQKIFAQVETLCRPDAAITSNSSSYPISEIGKGLASQNRMAGLHYFMPAHLIPLVEVVSSVHTDPQVGKYLCDVIEALNKRPVWVKKDIPGFLANRIQHALMREAIFMVEQGIASPEDVDAAVQLSFGIRYVGAGPLLQKDFSGIDVQNSAASRIYPDLCNASEPSPYMQQLVADGNIGVKSGKGFYSWTKDQITKQKTRYEEALISALKIIRG